MAPKGNLRWRKSIASRAAGAQADAAPWQCMSRVRPSFGCASILATNSGYLHHKVRYQKRLGSHEICRRTMLWRTRSVYTPR